ncbi:phosphoribosyl-ATP diphosphatase domain protein [Trichinella nativa]|uniref:Phosphoribosyl-ATP diphosphatase domain protein n=1 Tax=Trichinella nativa TaxID=6335 RepID=A0A1Y3EVU6_9BILA|nr:phosphoribosyl-ATP diphosphatase domain protein [Trichinella nativa]
MKFFRYSVGEKLDGSLYGVGAPSKYSVLTNQEMTNSETEECDAERPKLTDAQLEAGMMSQNVEISEQLEETSTRDCANSEEDEDLAEAFQTYLYYFMIFFVLSIFMFSLWLTWSLLCKS